MADPQQITILFQGITAWNTWRELHPEIWLNLDGINLSNNNLAGINFSKTTFQKAVLQHTNLERANLSEAFFIGADLSGANLKEANLRKASLSDSILRATDFSGANLTKANLYGAILIYTDMTNATLNDCIVWGTSVWHVKLEAAKQTNLIITPPYEPTVTVDNLKVAQFIYLLLDNQEIREVIDTIAKKAVLILGRFTSERKAVLDVLRDALRAQGYLPILFDFQKPESQDLTGTVSTLANISRFIIADLTDPSCSPYEIGLIAPCMKPIKPLFQPSKAATHDFAMFQDLRKRYAWVLSVYRYKDQESLLASMQEKVIAPAEKKVQMLEKKKRR